MRRSRWIWILIFVLVTGLLVTLATSWNVVLLRNYKQMLELAQGTPPWLGTILGTLGFVAVVAGVILLFWRLFHEMRLNQIQAEFLARVSHELKTPIATIELAASLIRSKIAESGGSSQAEDLAKLWKLHESELERLKSEVEALLEAARLESRPEPARISRMDLESWIEGASPRWQDILGANAAFRREGDRFSLPVLADPKLMDLVANNLVDNARKFAKNGRPELTVVTRVIPASRSGRLPRWQVKFRDSGWGFAPSATKRIFRRFHREKTPHRHAVPGTGLGLFLSGQAARAIGLRLFAVSGGPGEGATFVLEGEFTS